MVTRIPGKAIFRRAFFCHLMTGHHRKLDYRMLEVIHNEFIILPRSSTVSCPKTSRSVGHCKPSVPSSIFENRALTDFGPTPRSDRKSSSARLRNTHRA